MKPEVPFAGITPMIGDNLTDLEYNLSIIYFIEKN